VKTLDKIIKKHGLENMNTEKLLANIADIYKRHNVLVNDVGNAVNDSFAGATTFIDCPDCGSKTMLGFGECHLCGTSLYETEETEAAPAPEKVAKPKKETKVKKAKVAAPVKEEPTEAQELAEDLVDDLGLDDDFDLEEDEVEAKPAPKKTAKKTSKKVAAKKEEENLEDFDDDELDDLMDEGLDGLDDDDLDFDLD
jgi:hypothetical protein